MRERESANEHKHLQCEDMENAGHRIDHRKTSPVFTTPYMCGCNLADVFTYGHILIQSSALYLCTRFLIMHSKPKRQLILHHPCAYTAAVICGSVWGPVHAVLINYITAEPQYTNICYMGMCTGGITTAVSPCLR